MVHDALPLPFPMLLVYRYIGFLPKDAHLTGRVIISAMVIVPHAAVSALLGSRASNPAAAFMLGVASHFALDALPHSDYPIEGDIGKLNILLDGALGVGVALLIARKSSRSTALWGLAGGLAPDVVSFSQRLFLGGSTAWHDWAHGPTMPLAPSLACQAALSGAALVVALRLRPSGPDAGADA